MKQAIMDGETGERLFIFDYEHDLSGLYDYSEFNDFSSELMCDDLKLQKKMLEIFVPLERAQVHRIINVSQTVGDVVTLLESDSELIRSYFDKEKKGF